LCDSFDRMTKSTAHDLAQHRRRRDKRRARAAERLQASQANASPVLRASGEPLSLVAAAQSAEPNTMPSFTAIAYTGGPMYPRLAIPWSGPVVVDLAGLEASDTNPIHRDHDESKPVGHSTSIANDGTRLVCSGVFSVPGDDTSEIIAGAKNGFPWRPSVGVKMIAYTKLQAGQTATINGRVFVGPLLVITKSQLKEISLVTVPGDDSATISIAAAHQSMSFEQYVQSLGLDPATLSPEAAAALQISYAESLESAAESSQLAPGMDAGGGAATAVAPAQSVASAAAPESPMAKSASSPADLNAGIPLATENTASVREFLAAEMTRANQHADICAGLGVKNVMVNGQSVDLAAHAVRNGWTVEQTELAARRHLDLEATRDARPRGPAIHSRSSVSGVDLAALQAGMLLRAGTQLDSEAFASRRVRNRLQHTMPWLAAGVNDTVRQRAMDAGHQYSDLSLIDSCRLALQASGRDVPSNRIDMVQAAFSSGSVAALFGATIGAKMLQSYEEVEDFSRGWCSEEDNPDLEQHNRNRMQATNSLVLHPVGGDAPHASRTLLTERAQVYRFTRQMVVDEADIFGDNFGKLKDTPADFGGAAGRVRPDMVAAVLLSNPTLLQTGRALFNTTDGNSVASGKALARATLSEMIAAIAKRRDGDATLNLKQDLLIVPSDLADTAIQLCYSANLSNDSGSGEINPIRKYGIDVIPEPRLANGMTHPVTGANLSGSATQYYGLASKGRTIEVTYLQGAGRVPVVRSENLTGGQFGLMIDVRHYIGATPLDWRPWHRFNA
jgi:hypothetical protein